MNPYRIGFGYDVHKLSPGRSLIVGGVTIPHSKGAKGHSDADVLLHAVTDALLGAAALGDIGTYFPDTDPRFKNMDSMVIVAKAVLLLKEKNFTIGNIDATVVLQKPKISPHIPEMRKRLAAVLGIDIGEVSIKASTTEHLGFAGREEGIAAYAVAMLIS
ncbi:MAG: 2-C-methyl-D-erythritol 2,4-cyclodiphosphate synthase [Bacteroidales bacterium]|nr:2-C-methyl-D-erythritol 2,4-cyclodiphosphate synthase [Bacteroidales bacterium]